MLALHRKGMTAAEIAAALGVSHSCVRVHLLRSGLVPSANTAARWEAARQKFAATWNAAATPAEAAEALGLSEPVAKVRAMTLRREYGVRLKHFPPRKYVRRSPLGEQVEVLLRRGLSNREVMRRSGASLCYVGVIRKRTGLLTQPHWTPEQDVLFAKLTVEQVARETGKSLDSAKHRLQTLRRKRLAAC